MDTPLLWHIPLSHFNEKVSWALDYKGIGNRRKVLGPDYLVLAWRATGRATLPILFLDGRALGDSTHIITALEDRLPRFRCILVTPPPGSALSALEDYFDEQLAPALRSRRCSHPRVNTRCGWSCRRICRTIASRYYGIRPCRGRQRFTDCIGATPRKSCGGQLMRGNASWCKDS